MTVVLVILTGIVMGAVNVGFFLLGYQFKNKETSKDGVTLTENNSEFVKEMARWRAFGGNNGANS